MNKNTNKIKFKTLSLLLAFVLIVSTINFPNVNAMNKEGNKFSVGTKGIYLLHNLSGKITEFKKVENKYSVEVVSQTKFKNENGDIIEFSKAMEMLNDLAIKVNGPNSKITQTNAFALSQDGKYAYSLASSSSGKANGKSAIAILRYDAANKYWEKISDIDDWGDKAPNAKVSSYTKGGYDPISSSYVFSSSEAIDGKVLEKLWAYNVDRKELIPLGYVDAKLKDLFKYDGKITAVNGDLFVNTKGLTFVMSLNINGEFKAVEYEVPYSELEEAYTMKDKTHIISGKSNLLSLKDAKAIFNGEAIDLDGQKFVSNQNHIYDYDNNFKVIFGDTEEDKEYLNIHGANWMDSATISSKGVIVKYEDEYGNSIANSFFHLKDQIKGTDYDTSEHKKSEIINNSIRYVFKELKADSDPEKGTIENYNVIVTYVYKVEKEYKATHKFESEDKTKKLPKEVIDLVPAVKANLKDGSKVTPTEPTKKEVEVADGTWKFKGYDYQ